MSTNPTPKNVSCLKNLALNILKNGVLEVITKGVEVPELDPCSKCKEELFLYELKKPFTILICEHIYHRSCLEDYVKDLPQCPECAMEIESIGYARYSSTSEPSSQDQAQNTSDPMQISPQMTSSQNQNIVTPYTSLIFNPTLSYDLTLYSNYVDLIKNKKPKSKKRLHEESAKKEPPNLKKLIDELSTKDPNSAKNNIFTQSVVIPTTENDSDPVNFLNLYKELISAEDDNRKSNQEVIKRYYNFGLNLMKRVEYYKKSHKKQVAKILVNDEVRNQIFKEVSDDTLRKKTERARKIYKLFDTIGENKMVRVRSFTALTISKLSKENINHVILSIINKSK
ncbi:5453_t:CDS:1 [Scutellospora calospora]|uniref:5453_t:CDS:1 n=1 Tax=Scutellospora calospora TaxID=85575 RepID=A0ACA9KX41_9GLOM|nr:5453_t:CDS:1 [Scutellospora calospora]